MHPQEEVWTWPLRHLPTLVFVFLPFYSNINIDSKLSCTSKTDEMFWLFLPIPRCFGFKLCPRKLTRCVIRMNLQLLFIDAIFEPPRNNYRMSLGDIKGNLQTKYSPGVRVCISPRGWDNTICSHGGRRKDMFLTLCVLFLIPRKHEKLAAGTVCVKLRPSSTYHVWRNSEALPVWGHDLRPEIAS